MEMGRKMDEAKTEIPAIVIPRYSPSTPPKNYNKNKAISIFCCLRFSFGFRCPELLRATITSEGEIYVIPYSEYGIGDFHLSYHKSGRFHWGYDRTNVEPVCGETDFAAAFGLWLQFKQPLCFCFRKGRNLNDMEIVSLLQKLAENFPFTFDKEKAYQHLTIAKYYRLILASLKQ